MGGTYYTLETGALKVMEDFSVYANIFSVKNTTDNTDLFEKIFYLFNFYSFPNKVKGFFHILLYIIFYFYNIIFTILTFQLNRETINKNVLFMVICYFINMFFELFLPIFYYTRKKKKFIYVLTVDLLFFNH